LSRRGGDAATEFPARGGRANKQTIKRFRSAPEVDRPADPVASLFALAPSERLAPCGRPLRCREHDGDGAVSLPQGTQSTTRAGLEATIGHFWIDLPRKLRRPRVSRSATRPR